jgi:Tfp pilus assembly protein PilF
MGASFPKTGLPLLVLLCASGGCRDEAEQLLVRAHRALDADDYQTATQLFREITIAFPDSPDSARAHYELAQIYHLRIRDAGAAEASLLKILSDYPESGVVWAAHNLLGRIYERDLGLPEKAPAHYQEALGQPGLEPPERREALLALGDCYYRLDRNDEAEAAYRRAVELPYHPSADGAYARLAALSRLRGDDDAALDVLDELAARTEDGGRRYQALREQVEILVGGRRFREADERLGRVRSEYAGEPELEELQARLERERELDEEPQAEETAAIEELEKRIHWGSGRRRARDPR